ncbi:MAG: DUF4906 domain-containing protein [Bacteroidales bacterium]|nr:DUF4906 domain-containing protein [Bacteroidales bacterium]
MKIQAYIVPALVLLACSCSQDLTSLAEESTETRVTRLVFSGIPPSTKASKPDENALTDLNLFVFNEHGILEERLYLPASKLYRHEGDWCRDLKMHAGGKYSVYAMANAGYPLSPSSLEEVKGLRYHLAWADDYSTGIPMSGQVLDVTPSPEGEIRVPMERMMAKLTLRVDRGGLDEDVNIDVSSVKVGVCPRSALVFADSRVESPDQMFSNGFTLGALETDPLNFDQQTGISYPVELYLLENLQPEEADSHDLCSYIEISASYNSKKQYTPAGRHVRYRFRIGDGGSHEVRRNRNYKVTVVFDGEGLGEGGWRVDSEELVTADTWFKAYPSSYVSCHVGDTVHLWAEFAPASAPFSIGMEELEEEKGKGLCDYEIDGDGLGVRLFARKTGTALYYFEVGEPVNDAAMFFVVIDP